MNNVKPASFANRQGCAGFFVSHAMLVRILGVSMAEPEKEILIINTVFIWGIFVWFLNVNLTQGLLISW